MPSSCNNQTLRAGIAVSDITPPLGYRMCGYFDERLSTAVNDPLLAKAVVFEQGSVKAAFVFADLCHVDRRIAARVRREAQQRTGIPASHVAVSATHSHTGPLYFGALRDLFLDRTIRGYGTDVPEGVLKRSCAKVSDPTLSRAGRCTRIQCTKFYPSGSCWPGRRAAA